MHCFCIFIRFPSFLRDKKVIADTQAHQEWCVFYIFLIKAFSGTILSINIYLISSQIHVNAEEL